MESFCCQKFWQNWFQGNLLIRSDKKEKKSLKHGKKLRQPFNLVVVFQHCFRERCCCRGIFCWKKLSIMFNKERIIKQKWDKGKKGCLSLRINFVLKAAASEWLSNIQIIRKRRTFYRQRVFSPSPGENNKTKNNN